jgi:DNA-binding transcriptional MerR regulator/methylmalonyl-CoA mutase cobalamin-binding subunit
MSKTDPTPTELTYPLRTAARLTGLSPELLRAWERRHGVVQPQRTPGGTRRYTAADLERLRLVKAAVDAGHRISQAAQLEEAELRRRFTMRNRHLEEILTALDNLEGSDTLRLLSQQLSTLGPARFAKDVAMPLVHEIGDRWVQGRMGIASEHLASSSLRSLLGSALQPTAGSLLGPRIIFATPSGERHELGLLMAALTALGAGANPLYLGLEMPLEDLLSAARDTDAAALAISLVSMQEAQAVSYVSALRAGLEQEVQLWLGGVGARELELPSQVECFQSLDELERHVMLLSVAGSAIR